jgi:serine/threonine protein kinase
MSVRLSQLTVDARAYQYDTKAQLYGTGWTVAYQAVRPPDEQPVALKVVATNLTSEWQKSYLREVEILATNDHPATLRLIGFSLPLGGNISDRPVIITPFQPNGSIGDQLKKAREQQCPAEWNATTKSKCVFGIAAGMAYLHSREVMHRNLKPETVFLNAEWEPIIGEFEFAKWTSGDPSRTIGIVGSPLFIAPEICAEGEASGDEPPYDLRVDVYSYAVLLYQLFSSEGVPKLADGTVPKNAPQLLSQIAKGGRFAKPGGVPAFYWTTIQRCWAQAASDRPTFAALVQEFRSKHEYVFAGADIDEVKRYEEVVAGPAPAAAKKEPAKK